MARRLAARFALVPMLLLAACAGPGSGGGLPRDLPLSPDASLPLVEKAARLDGAIGELHLLPWGTLAYRLRLPDAPGAPPAVTYVSDQAAWTGALLGAECERWAATKDPAALERVRTLLRGLSTLSAVTGERGFFARFACPAGFLRDEPHRYRWSDGAPGFEGWRWRGDISKDQAAGIVHGLAAVVDLVDDPWSRARAARLLGDMADRLLGRDCVWEDGRGAPTTFGDMHSHVWGLPVGVNAAIVLGLADAASRGTGDPRHRRMLEDLVAKGAAGALRVPTVRLLGKEGWSNANMTAMALASLLRRPAAEGDAVAAELRAAAVDSMRRLLALHRGEGNAYWIALAAPAGAAAGATPAELADARLQLRRYSLDRRDRRTDYSDPASLPPALGPMPRAFWNSKGGNPQFTRPLPVDLQGAGAFIWKSNPFEVVQEAEGDERTVYAGADFLAAYWPLRRLGILGPGD